MTLNVIVVCGGQGTRIKSILGDTPKILAPILNHTFLDYLVAWIYCSLHPLTPNIILATGFGHAYIQEHVNIHNVNCRLIREQRQLGTYGAVINAIRIANLEGTLLVLNGDTMFDCNLYESFNYFLRGQCESLLIVKKARYLDRYGGFKLVGERLHLTSEDPDFFSLGAFFSTSEAMLHAFSLKSIDKIMMLDRDFLDHSVTIPFALPNNALFIDIGIPSDLTRSINVVPAILKL